MFSHFKAINKKIKKKKVKVFLTVKKEDEVHTQQVFTQLHL